RLVRGSRRLHRRVHSSWFGLLESCPTTVVLSAAKLYEARGPATTILKSFSVVRPATARRQRSRLARSTRCGTDMTPDESERRASPLTIDATALLRPPAKRSAAPRTRPS